jgi:hypothetical protein
MQAAVLVAWWQGRLNLKSATNSPRSVFLFGLHRSFSFNSNDSQCFHHFHTSKVDAIIVLVARKWWARHLTLPPDNLLSVFYHRFNEIFNSHYWQLRQNFHTQKLNWT